MERGLNITPQGFTAALNFPFCNFTPIALAKQDPKVSILEE
jgi:hypothetical protein